MSTILRELTNKGFLIFEEEGQYTLMKVPTPCDPRSGLLSEDKIVKKINFTTYQKALDHASVVAGIEQEKCYFAAAVRFNRGLGWEHRDLPGVYANRVSEAKSLAAEQANEYFASRDDLKDHQWSEVRVRPGRLG